VYTSICLAKKIFSGREVAKVLPVKTKTRKKKEKKTHKEEFKKGHEKKS
jgi:hypothetical protein